MWLSNDWTVWLFVWSVSTSCRQICGPSFHFVSIRTGLNSYVSCFVYLTRTCLQQNCVGLGYCYCSKLDYTAAYSMHTETRHVWIICYLEKYGNIRRIWWLYATLISREIHRTVGDFEKGNNLCVETPLGEKLIVYSRKDWVIGIAKIQSLG